MTQNKNQMSNTKPSEEWRKRFQECNGYMCNHETPDVHFIVGEDELEQVIQATREETAEIVETYLYGLDSVPWEEQVDDFVDSLKHKRKE